jgi:hypothetical protein
LRGCESGGDGEETRRRRRVRKKVQQQLEREREPALFYSLSNGSFRLCGIIPRSLYFFLLAFVLRPPLFVPGKAIC